MNRLERLYAINEHIRRHQSRPVSAAALARQFEVTRRTIERDLAALRSSGVPLYAEYGRNGGQHTLDRRGAVVVTLSTAEVVSLVMALASAGTGMPFSDAGSAAVRRLLDGLGEQTRFEVDALRRRIRTGDDAAQEHAPVSARVRRTVEEAVRRGVVVNVVYADANDSVTERSVDALGFYRGGDAWFLIGWCHLRNAGRIFRLDRVTSARITRRPVTARDLDDTLGWVPHNVRAP